jgi:hypothetical protein
MHSLAVPNHWPELHQALGRLAIAHTHLEQILRYTVKTLSELSGPTSLDSTKRKPISFLRKKIKRLFKKSNPSPVEKIRLDELLKNAKLLSERRNSYLHRAWSETPEGQTIVLGEGLQSEVALSEAEVEQLVSEILSLGEKLNHDRLHGFIHEGVQRQPQNAQSAP